MKPSIYAFLSICLLSYSLAFSPVNAQSFEHCWQEFFISIATDVAYSEYDDTWVVGGQEGNFSENNWPSFDAYLAKFDMEGNLLWQVNNLTGQEIGNINEVLPLPNGDILVGGEIGACDLGGSRHLFKLNSEGETIWKENEDWGHGNVSELLLLPNNQVIVLEYEQISLMDLDGNFIWSFPLEDINYSLAILNENQFLIGGRNSLRIYESGSGNLLQERILQEGVPIWQADIVLNIIPIEAEDEYLVLLNNNTLLRIDENLTTLESFDLSSYFETSHHLTGLPNQRLGILGKHQEQSKVMILDKSLNKVNDFYFGNNNVFPTSIASSDQYIAVSGQNPSHQNWNGNSSSFIQVFSILEEVSRSETDAGIEAFSFSSAELLEVGFCWGEESLVNQITLKDVELEIKNFGENPINDIQVNFRSDNSCFSICSSAFTIMENFENLAIESNTSHLFNLGDITIPGKSTQSSYELCFWISIPNEKIDINSKNNIFCETVFFTDIEDKNPLSSFNLYPNPSQDKFTIEVPSIQNKELQLQVLDMQGKLLYQTSFPQKLDLDLSSYPIGVYLLKVSDGFNSHTEKLFRH